MAQFFPRIFLAYGVTTKRGPPPQLFPKIYSGIIWNCYFEYDELTIL